MSLNPEAVSQAWPRLRSTSGLAKPSGILWRWVGAAMVLQGLLAVLMRQYSALATLHGVLAFIVCAAVAWTSRNPVRAACAGAYLVGCEVLWRVCQADLFWGFGKYATALVLFGAWLRQRRFESALLPGLYFLLLLPAIIVPLRESGLDLARRQISHELSGPFSLALAATFFTAVVVRSRQRLAVGLALLIPLFGLSCVLLFRQVDLGDLDYEQFATTSSAELSGGFGPNQVSSMLGLGGLLAFLLGLHPNFPGRLRWLAFLGLLLFATQSVLTFSRTGIYLIVGSVAAGALFLWPDARARTRLIVGGAGVLLVGLAVILPLLIRETGGAIVTRFSDVSPTGRDTLMEVDLDIFAENLPFGAGVGMATAERAQRFRRMPSHTEFTRMLAEHGVPGLMAMGVMTGLAVFVLARTPRGYPRAFVASCFAWTVLYMMGCGMRLAAPGFVFGLAAAPWVATWYQGRSSVKAGWGMGRALGNRAAGVTGQ